MADLRAKVEAVRELKQEYNIGSQDALTYLKARQAFSDLADKVAEQLKSDGVNYRPGVREVSNLCFYAKYIFGSALSVTGIRAARALSSENMPKDHSIKAYYEPLTPETSTEETGMDDVMMDWKFDYEEFLNVFFPEYARLRDYEIAMRTAFANAFAGSHLYIEDPRGKKLSFRDFEKDESLLISEVPMEEEREEYLEGVLNRFQRWFKGAADIVPDFNFSPEKMTDEEKKFLLGLGNENLYERAEKEMQLHNIEYERRIALSEVVGRNEDLSETSIDYALDILRNSLSKRLARLKELTEMAKEKRDYDIVVKMQEHLVRKTRYAIKAIKINRKWLKRMLEID